jgi:hypothetical protein
MQSASLSSSNVLLPQEQRRWASILEKRDQAKAILALQDAYYWLTECTKTVDEQDPANPYKPFPKRRYIKPLLDALERLPVPRLMKSRTMMASWTVAGYCAHFGFTHPATGVIFQSQDHDRALQCLKYVKVLWENSIAPLKDQWRLSKKLEKQAFDRFELANDTWFQAIPGDPNKIRSAHPTIVVFDEAQLIEQYEESYSNAVAARCLKVICIGTAAPGPYWDLYEQAAMVDWPDWDKEAA